MTTDDAADRHDLKNQLGIVLGFAQIVLGGMGPDGPWRAELLEIQKAANAALDLLARRAAQSNPEDTLRDG